jgi:hypothetical protein
MHHMLHVPGQMFCLKGVTHGLLLATLLVLGSACSNTRHCHTAGLQCGAATGRVAAVVAYDDQAVPQHTTLGSLDDMVFLHFCILHAYDRWHVVFSCCVSLMWRISHMDDPTSRRHGGRHSQVARQQGASATIRDGNIHCLAQQMPVSVYVQLVKYARCARRCLARTVLTQTAVSAFLLRQERF